MTDLIRLRRPSEPIRHPDDVALLREALARLGYTASDQDIQEAYSEWSQDNYCAGWIPVEDAGYATVAAQRLIGEHLEPAE